ncbi:MAG: DUF5131 family protein [Beijerinckiaceae bacterium]
MTSQTEIEWTDATWNPTAGCTIISPGCTNCYAQRMAARLAAMGVEKYKNTTRKSGKRAVWSGKINIDDSALNWPLSVRKSKRIFVNSMSDLFHENISDQFVLNIWDVMEQADWHSFQVLTKRPERMRSMMKSGQLKALKNVWLGTTVESSDFLYRIDALRDVAAAIRFISFEPLLSRISEPDLTGIDWAIVGGESGPNARLVVTSWVEELRDSCLEQGVAFFFKQWGGKRKSKTGRMLGGRTWDEYPIDISYRPSI